MPYPHHEWATAPRDFYPFMRITSHGALEIGTPGHNMDPIHCLDGMKFWKLKTPLEELGIVKVTRRWSYCLKRYHATLGSLQGYMLMAKPFSYQVNWGNAFSLSILVALAASESNDMVCQTNKQRG